MLGSITPLGERGHDRRWSTTVTHYLLGSMLGGALIGGAAGLAGAGLAALGLRPPGPVVLVVLAALCLVGGLLDSGRTALQLPTVHRQVNEDWLVRYRGWVIGGGFGFQLGLGVVTIVTTATVYVMLAAAVLSGSAAVGLLLGVVFGLARALPLLAARRVDSPMRLREQHLRLSRWAPRVHTGAIAVQVVVALVAVGTVLLATAPGGIST